MTPAERKRSSRENKERDELVRLIVRRIRTSEHTNISKMRRNVAKIVQAAPELRVEDLREIAGGYRVGDYHGRDEDEGHTGGFGTTKIDQMDGRQQIMDKIGGKRVRVPDHEDANPVAPSVSALAQEILSAERDAAELFHAAVIEKFFDGDENDTEALFDPDGSVREKTLTCRCPGCGFRCSFWYEARAHVDEQVEASLKQAKFVQQLREIAESTPGYEVALHDAVKAYDERGKHRQWFVMFERALREGYFRDIPETTPKP